MNIHTTKNFGYKEKLGLVFESLFLNCLVLSYVNIYLPNPSTIDRMKHKINS